MTTPSRSGADRPSTTPKITSPRTMIVNSPNRSTSESVGGRPSRVPVNRATNAIAMTQAMPKPVHTTSRGASGRKALATISGTATAMAST
jgi:hypothetical protein